MNIQDAINKAAKLLRLAKSDNANEAAVAAAKAQEIVDRYKLTLGDVTLSETEAAPVPNSAPDEPIQDFARDPLTNKGRTDRWQAWLAMSIAKVNQTMVYTHKGNLALIGRPSDVAVSRYLFTWLSAEVDRLAVQHCTGCSRTYWNNFRLGAVETISRRLAEQQKATFDSVRSEALAIVDSAKQSHALTVINNNASLMVRRAMDVEKWAKDNMQLRSRSASSSRYHESARNAGRRAGESVQLRAGGGQLTSGTHKLC